MRINKDKISYLLIRIFIFPFQWMPYPLLRLFGKGLGILGYYFLRDFRKRALSNLALAKDLSLSFTECKKMARRSFTNLAINCLEYGKFYKEKNLDQIVVCENPEEANKIYSQGKGIVFFCGHQSNWEVLFLDGTRRMRGTAIGKAIKNKRLYYWILKIRQRFGGSIITPTNAFRHSLKALKQGIFLGIVGDQGMPDSGYSFPFLGRKAWTSPLPALLSIKTQSPIIVATTKRAKHGYRIHYSDPIWPDLSLPIEKEMKRLMDHSLTLLQESIKRSPAEWLWQHNRWKQQTPRNIYKRFRKDSILIILPQEEKPFSNLLKHLPTFRLIYPSDFLFLMVPEKKEKEAFPIEVDEIFLYARKRDLLLKDFRFKLIYNFSRYRHLKKHYLKLSVYNVYSEEDLISFAKNYLPKSYDLSDILKRSICRPGSLWHMEENASQ